MLLFLSVRVRFLSVRMAVTPEHEEAQDIGK